MKPVILGKISEIKVYHNTRRVWVTSKNYPDGICIDTRTEYRVCWSETGFPTNSLHQASDWALRSRLRGLQTKEGIAR